MERREFLGQAVGLAAAVGVGAGLGELATAKIASGQAAAPEIVRAWRVKTSSGVTWLSAPAGWPTLDAAFRRGVQIFDVREFSGRPLILA